MLISQAVTRVVRTMSCLRGEANKVWSGQAGTGVRRVASRPMALSEDRRRVCSTHKGNLLGRVPPRNAPGATISQTHTPFGRCHCPTSVVH